MERFDIKDLLGGTAVSGLGLFVLYNAFGYPMGTASSMGPGYFPALLGGITLVLGLLITVQSLFRRGALPKISWRPLLAVLGSVLLFVLLMRSFGLLPAIVATIGVSSLGDRQARLLSTLLLAAGCALGAWLIFDVGLGLSLPMLRVPF